MSAEKPQKIVVRMPNWIGDLVMATPVLTDLRKAFPTAHLTAMCRSPLTELLRLDPSVNECISFRKKMGGYEETARHLRKGGYDLGILLTHSFSSAWWLWQGKVKKRIGYQGNGRNWLLSSAIPLPLQVDSQHLTLTYKNLLTPLGIPISSTAPKLYVSEEEKELARRSLPQSMRLIGINAGAAYGSAKCWIPSRFREVAEKLLSHEDTHLLFFGDATTSSLVDSIVEGLPRRVTNLAGKTSLRELASYLSICNLLLSNDSGPMHMADALGLKVVALFGSTNDIVTGPYHPQTLIHKRVACSPCYKRTCPIDFRCMNQIEVSEVYQAIMNEV